MNGASLALVSLAGLATAGVAARPGASGGRNHDERVLMRISGTYWHGIRSDVAHESLCSGRSRLALQEDFASDPGDLGWGTYVTKLKWEAEKYGYVVKVSVALDRAIDLRAKGAARAWFQAMTERTGGNPVRGSTAKREREVTDDDYRYKNAERWADRIHYARAWRERCLDEGIDGLAVQHWDLGETVVAFEPEKSLEIERPCRRHRARVSPGP